MWDIFIKVVAHNLQKLAGPNQIPFWTDGTPSNVWRDAQPELHSLLVHFENIIIETWN